MILTYRNSMYSVLSSVLFIKELLWPTPYGQSAKQWEVVFFFFFLQRLCKVLPDHIKVASEKHLLQA